MTSRRRNHRLSQKKKKQMEACHPEGTDASEREPIGKKKKDRPISFGKKKKSGKSGKGCTQIIVPRRRKRNSY